MTDEIKIRYRYHSEEQTNNTDSEFWWFADLEQQCVCTV